MKTPEEYKAYWLEESSKREKSAIKARREFRTLGNVFLVVSIVLCVSMSAVFGWLGIALSLPVFTVFWFYRRSCFNYGDKFYKTWIDMRDECLRDAERI